MVVVILARNFFCFSCFLGNLYEQTDVVLDRIWYKECETEKNGMGHGEAGWWKEQFDNADIDQSGSLSFDEFKE